MTHLVKRLPVQIALAMLLIYGVTLSREVTLSSLSLTAKLAGWDGVPFNSQPLLWLFTLPLRMLPAGWMSVGVNFFSALLAALILGILARSLQLADWETLSQKSSWRAKIPLLLACVLCGFEFNFWREATAATGEMLQLLLLASAIWCLLEYRLNRNLRWLRAATFIWGLGLAENWMMMFTLPAFVFVVFWFGRLQILSKKIILDLTLTMLGGFSTFLILPLANTFLSRAPQNIFENVWLVAKDQKNTLDNIRLEFLKIQPMALCVVIVFFLATILPMLLRRQKTAHRRRRIEKLIYRWQMIVWLFMCVWLAFDPAMGPRQIVLQQTGWALPFLSLDFFGGFCAGYLSNRIMLAWLRNGRHTVRKIPRAVAIPIFTTFLILLATGLFVRNAAAILAANRQPLTQFYGFALQQLPPDGEIILDDDPLQLTIFQAAAAGRKNSQWLVVNARLLPRRDYREQLAEKKSADWLTNSDELTKMQIVKLISQLAQAHPVYLLQDSYGFLFENFYLEPAGPVFALKKFPDRNINPPSSDAAMTFTEQFWDRATPQMDEIEKAISARDFSPPSPQREFLANKYSVALDNWGVRLQRAGQLKAAGKRFVQAFALNTNNIAARINLEGNTNLIAGRSLDIAMNPARIKVLAGEFGDFSHANDFLARFGMVDDPAFCCVLGGDFAKAGLPRQSVQQFERAETLAPSNVIPKFALASLYLQMGAEEKARQLIAETRVEIASFSENDPQKKFLKTALSLMEADSWLAQANITNADAMLRSLLQEQPRNLRVENLALRAYMAFGDYSNALELVDARLAANPADVNTLLNKAVIYQRLGAASNSIATFNAALVQKDAPYIRLLRDNAYIQAGKLDMAEADYLDLDKTAKNYLPIYYGLAEIAMRRHQTNDAIVWLTRCLRDVPENSRAYPLLTNRLEALQSHK